MPHYSTDWGVIGHEWAVQHLATALTHGRLRHAYLIAGQPGVGKTTLAKGFAQAINCLSDTLRPCGECRACRQIAAGTYADLNIIEAQERTLKIEQIRDLQHTLVLKPVEARYRIVVLENFHEATPQAQDALLKTLEEPPAYVVIMATVDRVESVLSTIRSRCQPISLRPLPTVRVKTALEARGINAEQAALLAQLSGGRLGWAYSAATDENTLKMRETALTTLERLISADRITRFKYIEELASNRDAFKEMIPDLLAYWQSYLRDVLLLISGTQVSITNRDHRHPLDQLAAALHVEDVQKALTGIERTEKYLRQNANPRLALEVLMMDLPRHRLLPAPPGVATA